MDSLQSETQIILAIQAIRTTPKLSIRRAANIYKVPRSTLATRIRGTQARRDSRPNCQNLTALEENAIVQRIIELDSQAFPPRLSAVEDMANRLLSDRDAQRVGKNWASNFVKRQPRLKTVFSRKYDYSRALCEDPELIQGWFSLVHNTILKYGIADADIYNFDETGFAMGQIVPSMVVTSSDRRGKPKLAQPGNREWATVIQGVNAQGWTVPPFIIVKGKCHLSSWYEISTMPEDWRIAVSDNGWTTNELTAEWLQHFDKYTESRKTGVHRLLILDGHESHHSDAFEQYCKDHNIITLCMPAHSSHILQPLDVACFGPLKKAYGAQIEGLIRARISHITKDDFLPAFCEAFEKSMTEHNVRAGFRGAGLVPFSPEVVISRLDVKVQTPMSSRPSSREALPWASRTPNNPTEATSQSEFLKGRIARHQNSSPTSIYNGIDQIAKGASRIMYRMALLQAEVAELREVNTTISKRRKAKRIRLQCGGSISKRDAQELRAPTDVAQQLQQEPSEIGGDPVCGLAPKRCCTLCGETGHNARTCRNAIA